MNFLKKRGVAWVITIVMILLAITIGRGRATVLPINPLPPTQTVVPLPDQSDEVVDSVYVFDNAGVLSPGEIQSLSLRNQALIDSLNVVIACFTVNYGGDDLYRHALELAEENGLGAYDFIVVLDISGDNYWLVQGSALIDEFTDDDCGNYAWACMEDDFALGDYGGALEKLTQSLFDWYQTRDW